MTDGQLPPPHQTGEHGPGGNEWSADRIAAVAGGALIVAGCFGPWITASGGFINVSVNGMNGDDGKAMAALGALVVGLILVKRAVPAVVCAAIAGVLGGLNYFDVDNRVAELNEEQFIVASIGWGLYTALLGAAVAVLAGLRLHKLTKTTDPTASQPTPADPDAVA